MTRKKYIECDICETEVGHMNHLRIRRWLLGGFWVRLYEWGMTSLGPVSEGWRKGRVDICEDCFDELRLEIGGRVE